MTWHEAQYAVAHEPMEPPRSVLRIETADRDEVAAWLRDVAERIAPTPAGPRADEFLRTVNTLTMQLHDARRERDELRAAATELAEAWPEVDAVLALVLQYGNERFASGLGAGRGSAPTQHHHAIESRRTYQAIEAAVRKLAAGAGGNPSATINADDPASASTPRGPAD